MIDINGFIFFPDSVIDIGIDPVSADNIYKTLLNSNIKKDFITASTPKKTVKYNQFLIAKKLVTVKNFEKFIKDTSYITDAEKDGWGWVWHGKWVKVNNVSWYKPFLNESDAVYMQNAEIIPVMQTSWNDAVEYTKWLSETEGEIIRLPFEYEWEIFGNYAGLNSINDKIENVHDIELQTDGDFVDYIKMKIEKHIYQIGILWEWTLDWYDGYEKNVINKDFGNIYKTLRGGSLLSENIQKSKEFRFRRCPTARSPYYGFRLVLERK